MKIACVGMSHLGLVTAVSFALKNHYVLCLDDDTSLIEALKEARLPINEPDLSDSFMSKRSLLHFSSNFSEVSSCDLVYLTQDIFTDDDGNSNYIQVNGIIETLSEHLNSGTYVVILSQVHPGFTRSLSLRYKLNFVYQVETLIFGQALSRALNPERFIVGVGFESSLLSRDHEDLLKSFNVPIIRMNYESAELSKLAINLFLAASVTTTNSLAAICESVGANWNDISGALQLDRRIGKYAYLRPGLGISGGNIERDINNIIKLAQKHGLDSSIFESFQTNSALRKLWPARKLNEITNSGVKIERIAVWGLAYKRDTNSIKNSPAILNIRELVTDYDIHAYDPVIGTIEEYEDRVTFHKNPLDCLKDSQALLILTNWSQFTNIKVEDFRNGADDLIVIDPFGVYYDSLSHSHYYFSLGESSVSS